MSKYSFMVAPYLTLPYFAMHAIIWRMRNQFNSTPPRAALCRFHGGTLLIFTAILLLCRINVYAETLGPLPESGGAYLRENYTKYEYNIRMRDGVKLFVSVYAPKDNSKPCPLLLTRTPYSCKPYGVDRYPDPKAGPMFYYAAEKFIFVNEDVRGRYASEGTFVHM